MKFKNNFVYLLGHIFGGIQVNDLLFAHGCFVGNVLLDLTNCRGTGGPIQVKNDFSVMSAIRNL